MTSLSNVILPPATIGIIGGGQLGQMMALVAKSMGYRVGVLDPVENAPAAQVADFQIVGNYDDPISLMQLSQASEVLTYEFENVDQASLTKLESHVLIPQGTELLTITSNRLREKHFCRDHDLPVTPFAGIQTLSDLRVAIERIGMPGILKTVEGGYDGHGQIDVNQETVLADLAATIPTSTWIYERRQPFVRELSIMVTRDGSNQVVTFPVSINDHRNHILKTSLVTGADDETAKNAAAIATRVATALNLKGVLGIEFFELANGELLINELAPRPHNSGHYSIEACNVSQFEAHIRSICGLKIPTIQLTAPAVMVNLLGPDLAKARTMLPDHPEWHFHDYGKGECRPNRKMGHITVLGQDIPALLASTKDFR